MEKESINKVKNSKCTLWKEIVLTKLIAATLEGVVMVEEYNDNSRSCDEEARVGSGEEKNDWCGGDPLWNQWFHSGNLRWDLKRKRKRNEMWRRRELGSTNYNIVMFWLVNLMINEQKIEKVYG